MWERNDDIHRLVNLPSVILLSIRHSSMFGWLLIRDIKQYSLRRWFSSFFFAFPRFAHLILSWYPVLWSIFQHVQTGDPTIIASVRYDDCASFVLLRYVLGCCTCYTPE